MVGLCLIVGGLRYGEQGFRVSGASAYLVVLMPLATLTLILPTYTTSVPGPFYSDTQLGFVSLATLALYGVFLYVQTVRHRDYFLSDLGGALETHALPGPRQFWESVGLLLVGLIAVVLLAKGVAGSLEAMVTVVGAPVEAVGLLVALLVLLPETVAALRAARRNEPQPGARLLARHHRPHHPGRQPARDRPQSAAGARHRLAGHRVAGADLRRQPGDVRRRAHQYPAGLRASRAVRHLRLPDFRSVRAAQAASTNVATDRAKIEAHTATLVRSAGRRA